MKKAIASLVFIVIMASFAEAQIKVLIVDGQNNHKVWPKSTIMMKQYLEESGMFKVDIKRTKYTWRGEREKEYLPLAGGGETDDIKEAKADPGFAPEFGNYDVVVSNFGGNAANWPEKTQDAFERYMRKGGGFVSVHAADNSFPAWEAYNEMIGLGGWGGRTEEAGPYVYYTNQGELVRDTTVGRAGNHGARHEFPITVRVADHPITAGMPELWMSAEDECYAMLRGPGENMTILATGKDLSDSAPTDRHEPMLMVISYDKGRIFHTVLGHDDFSLEGVGFIVSFLRGVEWAATGNVTQPIPSDFPTAEHSSSRTFELKH